MGVAAAPWAVHKITCQEFQRMVDAGVFGPESHVELLDGEIIEMSPMSPDHAFVIHRLTRSLSRELPDAYWVRPQLPMIATPISMPEPDLAVERGREFEREHPTGRDIVLAIEVSLSSVSLDRRKMHIYAQAGVPEYWLIEVARRGMLTASDPGPDGYGSTRMVTETDAVAPIFARDARIRLAAMLPPVSASAQ